ncbi:MAG: glycosyltransferase family 1 protein, partial [Prevotella sp.]|nr:glycosyltransferase family 1 protein [Prevotella sp.]
CLYVGPDDVDGNAAAILSAIEHRKEIVSKSQRYVKRFENQDVASQILEVYNKV